MRKQVNFIIPKTSNENDWAPHSPYVKMIGEKIVEPVTCKLDGLKDGCNATQV